MKHKILIGKEEAGERAMEEEFGVCIEVHVCVEGRFARVFSREYLQPPSRLL